MNVTGIAATVVAGALLVAVSAGLGYRRLRQARVAARLRITGSNGIVQGRFVPIGGIEQWIHVRGSDRANPILLVVPGSGLTLEPFSPLLQAWETHFTVACWDRRDVGRPLGRNGRTGNESWTYELLAADGLQVAEYLCRSLGQTKVILLGHSQGSIVATLMARRRPNLFHAYVGTGQVADMPRNEQLSHRAALTRAQQAGNRRASQALARLAPPYRDSRTWIAKQRWSMSTDPGLAAWQRLAPAIVLTWPGYRIADVYRSFRGVLFMPPQIFSQTLNCTPDWLGTDIQVPYVILQGADDRHTFPELAREYLAAVRAPTKDFVLLPGCGHLALLQQPELLLTELLTRVRPLAATPSSSS